jgi:hypothetical protein
LLSSMPQLSRNSRGKRNPPRLRHLRRRHKRRRGQDL